LFSLPRTAPVGAGTPEDPRADARQHRHAVAGTEHEGGVVGEPLPGRIAARAGADGAQHQQFGGRMRKLAADQAQYQELGGQPPCP
jgi:hypothetical protein